MATQNHEYRVTMTWTGGRDGGGEAVTEHSGQMIPIKVPPEFQGPGGAVSPEDLLTAAVASCYSVTLGIIAANRKLPVTGIEAQVVGTVEQQGVSFTYKKVTVKPIITVSAEATDAQIATITDMAHKADGYCIITNAIRGKVEVSVEPQIVRA